YGSRCSRHVAASHGARTASYVRDAAATPPAADLAAPVALAVKTDCPVADAACSGPVAVSERAVAAACSGPVAVSERAVVAAYSGPVAVSERVVVAACSGPVAVSGRAVVAACSGPVVVSERVVVAAACSCLAVVYFYLAAAFQAYPAEPVSGA